MNNTERAIATAVVTIGILGITVCVQNKTIKQYRAQYRKLYNWAEIAQRVLKETAENNPGLNFDVSSKLAVDVEFYNLMNDEGLL